MAYTDNSGSIHPSDIPTGMQDIYSIIAGEALSVIERIGWKAYREKLNHVSWYSIANNQIFDIRRLRTTSENSESAISYTERQNVESYVRDVRRKFPKGNHSSFYAGGEGPRGMLGKKLELIGKEYPDSFNKKRTRIYMALDTRNFRVGFEQLRQELDNAGVLQHIGLMLNLECLQSETQGVDSIMLHIPNSDPEVLDKVIRCMKTVKSKAPNIWKLSPVRLAQAKTDATASFMVPLDESAWFVEIEREYGNSSYMMGVLSDFIQLLYQGQKSVINGIPHLDAYQRYVQNIPQADRATARISRINTAVGGTQRDDILMRRVLMPGLVIEN